MGKLIDLREVFKEDEDTTDDFMAKVNEALALLENLPDDVVDKVKPYVMLETQIMLGLSPLSEESIDEIEPVFSDDLWDLWDQANKNCYFCSDTVDPQEEGYGEKRYACPTCLLKLKSFLKAAGVKKRDVPDMLKTSRM